MASLDPTIKWNYGSTLRDERQLQGAVANKSSKQYEKMEDLGNKIGYRLYGTSIAVIK